MARPKGAQAGHPQRGNMKRATSVQHHTTSSPVAQTCQINASGVLTMDLFQHNSTIITPTVTVKRTKTNNHHHNATTTTVGRTHKMNQTSTWVPSTSTSPKSTSSSSASSQQLCTNRNNRKGCSSVSRTSLTASTNFKNLLHNAGTSVRPSQSTSQSSSVTSTTTTTTNIRTSSIVLRIIAIICLLFVVTSSAQQAKDPLDTSTNSSTLPPPTLPASVSSEMSSPVIVTSQHAALPVPASLTAPVSLVAGSTVNFRCPEQFGYYADEYNCSKYFVCVFGEALHESCTGGLRFSSELQTCDWPRNVICPSEDADSGYDDEDESGESSLDGTNGKKAFVTTGQQGGSLSGGFVSSGMIQDSPPPSSSSSIVTSPVLGGGAAVKKLSTANKNGDATSGQRSLAEGYEKEAKSAPILEKAGTLTTTQSPSISDIDTIGEIAIQETFDKLKKKKKVKAKMMTTTGVAASIGGGSSSSISLTGGSIASNSKTKKYPPINVLDLPAVNDSAISLSSAENGLDVDDPQRHPLQQTHYHVLNKQLHRHPVQPHHLHPHQTHHLSPPTHHNTHRVPYQRHGHSLQQQHQRLPQGHEEEDDATLVEDNFTLVDLQRSRSNVGQENSKYENNVLGRSINGGNRAQSVSVVASTSSEAIIPELDFVFNKKPTTSTAGGVHHTKQSGSNSGVGGGSILGSTTSDASSDQAFEDALAGLVNEDTILDENSPLYRLLASRAKSLDGNQLPGTAASNRNIASQQLVFSKTPTKPLGSGGVNEYITNSKKSSITNNDGSTSNLGDESSGESYEVKTLKTGSGTILVFNRTQLITVPVPNEAGVGSGLNTSSTLILIDHERLRQTPTSIVRGSSMGNNSSVHHRNVNSFDVEGVDGDDDFDEDIVDYTLDQSSDEIERDFQRIVNNNNNNNNATTSNNKLRNVFNRSPSISLTTQPPSTLPQQLQPTIVSKKSNKLPSNSVTPATASQTTTTTTMATPTVITTVRPSSGSAVNKSQRQSKSQFSSGSKNSTTSRSRSRDRHQLRLAEARANNRTLAAQQIFNVSTQNPSRPTPIHGTPIPLSNADKCHPEVCKLPDCFCGGTEIPGGLDAKEVPQLVLISFDDAVNDVNWHHYEELLNSGRSNPNGCPIKATFYVSHEWTDYSQIQTLYSRGHEIASHSITHGFGERYTKQQWQKEIVGQRDILNLYGGVNRADIRGMRAPFLQGGGNRQFEMLHEENFTYDSSMPVFENQPPFWPYTLDYAINHECMIAPCPTKSFPGLWEIGLVMWQDLHGGRCSMGDACSNPTTEDGVYEMIMKNFKRHYNSNRAPFGLYYHSAWFNSEHHRRGFLRVIDDLLTYYKDVYFVTKWELIQWMRNPTVLKELYRFDQFGCGRDLSRPAPCLHPNICNVNSHQGSRYLKTCQPCPKRYPWLDDNGRV